VVVGTAFGTLGGGIAIDSRNLYLTGADILQMSLQPTLGPLQALVPGYGLGGSMAANGTDVYWTVAGQNAVVGVAVDGGAPFTVASGQQNLNLIAADSNRVYWTTGIGAGGTLLSAPASGVPEGGKPTTMYTGPYAIETITIDSANLYLGTALCAPSPSTVCNPILSVPLDASMSPDASLDASTATIISQPEGPISALAIRGSTFYWEDSPACPPSDSGVGCGHLLSAPSSASGAPVTLASQVAYGPLVLDDANVYFSNGLSVMAVGLDGGPANALAPANPTSLVEDPTTLYWLEPTCSTGMCPIQLVSVAKP
jgi:hypothetical protein